ncbi:MAG: hypothetical protein JWR84_3639 [Caulobacter sp.]|nr:hypothetical protein [Caulobacter sp.]
MKRRHALLLAVAALVLLAGIVGGPRLWRYVSIDSCLDSGGRWDYQAKRCDFGPTRE